MMKKAIALLMTAMLMASVLVGCGDKGAADGGEPAAENGNSESDNGDETIHLKFGYAPPNVTEVFKSAENYLRKGVEDAKEHGIDIELIVAEPTGNETNYESQVTNLENLLAQSAMRFSVLRVRKTRVTTYLRRSIMRECR